VPIPGVDSIHTHYFINVTSSTSLTTLQLVLFRWDTNINSKRPSARHAAKICQLQAPEMCGLVVEVVASAAAEEQYLPGILPPASLSSLQCSLMRAGASIGSVEKVAATMKHAVGKHGACRAAGAARTQCPSLTRVRAIILLMVLGAVRMTHAEGAKSALRAVGAVQTAPKTDGEDAQSCEKYRT
jgi:hypothetical protein